MVLEIKSGAQRLAFRVTSLAPPRRVRNFMFNVYAIESSITKRIYIGYTKDIEQRLQYHNSGYVKSTAQDRPWILFALEKAEDENEARWLERSLKKSRGKRIKWLATYLFKE